MNFVRLSLFLLSILFVVGECFAINYTVWTSAPKRLVDDRYYFVAYGSGCDDAINRLSSYYGGAYVWVTNNCGHYNYSNKYNNPTGARTISCSGGGKPYYLQGTNPTAVLCSDPDDETPDDCDCVSQAECRNLEFDKDPSLPECYQASLSPNSLVSFIDEYTPPADANSCGEYYAVCDELDNICTGYDAAISPVCRDYCDLEENYLNPACIYNDCADNFLADTHCDAPTPSDCFKDPSAYGCVDWCSQDGHADYDVCNGTNGYPDGGMPSFLGRSCRNSSECLEDAKKYYNRECRDAINYTFDYQSPSRFSLTCEDEDGNTAGFTDTDGEIEADPNTTDSVNTPDRTSDAIDDDSADGLLLAASDQQIEALNSVNENLNAIETETRTSGDKLTTINDSLGDILTEMQTAGDGEGDFDLQPVSDGLGDLQSILQDAYDADREEAAEDRTPISDSPAVTETDISDLQSDVDVSGVTFNSDGFISDSSCPAPITVSVLGNSVQFSFDVFCQIAVVINAIVSAFAYFWAGRIFLREVS